MPELKLVDMDVFTSQSEEDNACFLSLKEKPPLHLLRKT